VFQPTVNPLPSLKNRFQCVQNRFWKSRPFLPHGCPKFEIGTRTSPAAVLNSESRS
jgi:hypothetical protein